MANRQVLFKFPSAGSSECFDIQIAGIPDVEILVKQGDTFSHDLDALSGASHNMITYGHAYFERFKLCLPKE